MTKAKEALDEMNDVQCIRSVKWVRKRFETIREALELLDKVQRGGVAIQQIDELQTLDDDEWTVLKDKYILIERE